ncbi:MAG: dihydrolipoamide acetyltransferase family protein [Bacteroidota bacterium]
MAKIDLIMPKMGESIIEATILKWTKQVGEEVEQEETILEIATDKVDSEVPSPADGTLMEILFEEGDVVAVGEVIARIETEPVSGESDPEIPSNGQHEAPAPELASVVESVPYVPVSEGPAAGSFASSARFYSPLVLNIAREEGISMLELEALPGSGRGGRVTKKDILSYVEDRQEAPQVVSAPQVAAQPVSTRKAAPKPEPKVASTPPPAPTPAPTITHEGNVYIIEMDRMRKIISQNMVQSKHTSAHVTSFVEADVTNLANWRKRVKGDFEKQYGEKLTFTPLFLQAVIKALREHPLINSSVDGDRILVKKDINVGIAVALPNYNLIVPVIKNADRLNLVGLCAAVNDLAARARANKLKPDELEGGTYTLSNVGTFGNVMGTPIILQPQVAILAVGSIRKLPSVIETAEGDMIAIRQKMFLSHSYDHRIVDGALGGRFVKRVADLLEAWNPETDI